MWVFARLLQRLLDLLDFITVTVTLTTQVGEKLNLNELQNI